MENTIQERIYEILRSVLNIKVDENTHLSMENCEQWNSLAHIDIVMSVEEEFGICFKSSDLPLINSQEMLIAKIKEILSNNLGGI